MGRRHFSSIEVGYMVGRVSKLSDYKWQIGAAAFLILGLMLSGNGLRALTPALRFLAPVLLIWLIYRFLRNKLKDKLGGLARGRLEDMLRQMSEQQQTGRTGSGVIDLCPECGAYLKPGHKCQTPRST